MNKNRITTLFQNLNGLPRRLFVPYLTAGFPRRKDTIDLLLALERGGSDLIELGVPFSDPVADGPVIQQSSYIALQNKVTLRWILETVRTFRQHSQCPLMLFTYYNPIFKYGLNKLAADAADAGVDGILVPDLPIEEAGELKKVMQRNRLSTIFLVTPTTPDKRIERIESLTDEFVYLVSIAGTTGPRAQLSKQIEPFLQSMNRKLTKPFVVGFGISTPEDAANIGGYGAGVVVGSALVKYLIEHHTNDKYIESFESYIASFTSALPGF